VNLTAILAVVLLWGASVFGAFRYGTDVGKDGEIAKNSEIKKAIDETYTKAMEGSAEVISKITVRNTTIQGRVETIVRDNTVYRDCRHDAAGLRTINQALTGESPTESTGDGSMPKTVTP